MVNTICSAIVDINQNVTTKQYLDEVKMTLGAALFLLLWYLRKGIRMLEIFGRSDSSNVQAVMWCVAELGLEYIRYDIGHRFGGTNTKEFIDMNPNQTVPVLRDKDGLTLWESGAILRYLANQYGDDRFWPQAPNLRAIVDKWAEWSKVSVAINFTIPIFWEVVRTPKDQQNSQLIDRAIKALEVKLSIADYQLAKHRYLAGDNFTLADIQLGHMLYRYFSIDIKRKKFHHLSLYYERLCERPMYSRHVMVSYEALRA